MAGEWWRSALIYQICPRSFQDSNGDGIGDLNGITERLGYVASLGVDAVWITPFFASPMADFGYDVADYRAIRCSAPWPISTACWSAPTAWG
jgi:alpha-glucosidase